ncbi:DUF6777 domain-containing protein [Streptomyces djakartensis]|uniref:DUF6777 domain-containing protein n=1 Tax=Streptomyces djakartensis TaxID=68193 RepID=A0ABQ3A6Q6_9ACTN|nr:DUF6777 domain-containing protein [Streptomyces djakartensis]GGY34019.1 hypothetical protein GCM10010384_46540 [Streptomyces djakartensis]
MSVEPPSSGRPTGPPSGPLSGPSQPPPGGGGPPSEPPSGGGTSPGPRRPWWGSVPRVALIAGAVVVAVILAVVFTRSDGGTDASDGATSTSDGDVFLQPAADTGPDPFTDSTAEQSSAPPVTPSPAGTASQNAVQGVQGGTPGLYGGTRNVSSCDVEKQITYLGKTPDKQRAFASVQRIEPSGVPAYLRSLTPVQLRMDTWVTNHGYQDGRATSYQAVLQAGTAVLVDDRGVPRARCACGNPLSPPVPQQNAPKTAGDKWPGYKSSGIVRVIPALEPVDVFVLCEPDGEWFERHEGDTGKKDRKTEPPDKSSPPVTTPTSPTDSTSSKPPTSEPPTSDTETSSEPPTDQSPPPTGNETGNDTGTGTGGDTSEQAPAS